MSQQAPEPPDPRIVDLGRSRVNSFRALAACMSGLGLVVGLVFPPFVMLIGVATPDAARSVRFVLVCLVAGQVLAGMNFLLVRAVVGRRLRQIAEQMHDVARLVSHASIGGDWAALDICSELPVSTGDQLERPTIAFNALVGELRRSLASRRELEAELRHQAFHDSLTGLANRLLFADHAEQALARLHRSGGCLAVLYIDLDRFKPVNDVHGHAVGDAVLMAVAQRLLATCRSVDTVARLGGDEFAVLAEGQNAKDAQVTAARLRSTLSRPMYLEDLCVEVGASIGLTVATRTTVVTPDELLQRADESMYLAKQARRGA